MQRSALVHFEPNEGENLALGRSTWHRVPVLGGMMKSSEWDDAPYVRRATQGDSDAWSKLVERYSGYVYALLRSARVPESDQPDAFQYVFVELFKNLGNLKATHNLTPWIRQTALRHAIRLRGKLGRTEALPEYDLPADSLMEQEFHQSEQNLVIRQAVESLKEKCRQLVTMLFLEDPPRPYDEVAEELGLRIGSIGSARARCLDALKSALRARGID